MDGEDARKPSTTSTNPCKKSNRNRWDRNPEQNRRSLRLRNLQRSPPPSSSSCNSLNARDDDLPREIEDNAAGVVERATDNSQLSSATTSQVQQHEESNPVIDSSVRRHVMLQMVEMMREITQMTEDECTEILERTEESTLSRSNSRVEYMAAMLENCYETAVTYRNSELLARRREQRRQQIAQAPIAQPYVGGMFAPRNNGAAPVDDGNVRSSTQTQWMILGAAPTNSRINDPVAQSRLNGQMNNTQRQLVTRALGGSSRPLINHHHGPPSANDLALMDLINPRLRSLHENLYTNHNNAHNNSNRNTQAAPLVVPVLIPLVTPEVASALAPNGLVDQQIRIANNFVNACPRRRMPVANQRIANVSRPVDRPRCLRMMYVGNLRISVDDQSLGTYESPIPAARLTFRLASHLRMHRPEKFLRLKPNYRCQNNNCAEMEPCFLLNLAVSKRKYEPSIPA